MTAEIAVANRIGLALAADSASTSYSREKVAKIYNTADKLFAIHEREPVGAMVYGSAAFGGVPWEILIKLFRTSFQVSCPTIENYGERFLDFLRNTPVITDEVVDMSFRFLVRFLFDQIDDAIRKEAERSHFPIEQAAKNFIDSRHADWAGKKFLDGMDANTLQGLKVRYDGQLAPTVGELLKKYNVTEPAYIDRLREFLLLYAVKDVVHDASGIVVAGFGVDEIFPALVAYDIECMVYPRLLRFRKSRSEKVTLTNSAVIAPFAQGEMVHSFMTGVDPPLRERISQTFGKVMTKLVDDLKSKLPSSLSTDELLAFESEGLKAIDPLLNEFDNIVSQHSAQRYIQPVLDAVGSLPKDQLAFMAETLVALTSFKKNLSMDSETVGGAIDVAVISKGDGFVWVKRKHYFDLALNPRYTERIRALYNQTSP
jgi:hypothetical protein